MLALLWPVHATGVDQPGGGSASCLPGGGGASCLPGGVDASCLPRGGGASCLPGGGGVACLPGGGNWRCCCIMGGRERIRPNLHGRWQWDIWTDNL